jgi:CheY-like chemotaxis protein
MPDNAALNILLVEDEPLIAMTATDLLDALGHHVVAVAPSVEDALKAIEIRAFDIAMLDVNLNECSSLPVADRLRATNKRYFFTTGYGSGGVNAAHRDVPVLTKPYTLAELEAVLDAL